MTARILDGVRFLRDPSSGMWESEDGRFRIEEDPDNTTYCDNPHPVMITQALAASVKENPSLWCTEAKLAVADQRKGYLCPGGEEHGYTTWHVWDDQAGDYVGGEAGFGSFTDATRHFVRWHIQQRRGDA